LLSSVNVIISHSTHVADQKQGEKNGSVPHFP
jgi:hypothetical protein